MAADADANANPTPGPERTEGPTPAGGAYAIAYRHDDGSMEIVEFESDGHEIRRTYSAPPRPAGDDAGPGADARL